MVDNPVSNGPNKTNRQKYDENVCKEVFVHELLDNHSVAQQFTFYR